MRFGQPIPITDGVFQIQAIGARVTLLVEGGDALLVDAGFRGSAGVITQGLEALGLSPDRIRAGSCHPRSPRPFGRPRRARSRKRHWGRRAPAGSGHRRGAAPAPSPLQNGLLAMAARPVLARLTGDAVPVDDRLDDSDVVPFGTEVRVVHLPGHTPGSIALHLPAKRAVIIGDALQYKLGWRLGPPAPGVTQRPRQAMRSVEKLLDLDFGVICFSHFPPMRGDPREALKKLIQRQAA